MNIKNRDKSNEMPTYSAREIELQAVGLEVLADMGGVTPHALRVAAAMLRQMLTQQNDPRFPAVLCEKHPDLYHSDEECYAATELTLGAGKHE